MSPNFTHVAGKAWMGAHRLVTYPEELHLAREASQTPDNDKTPQPSVRSGRSR